MSWMNFSIPTTLRSIPLSVQRVLVGFEEEQRECCDSEPEITHADVVVPDFVRNKEEVERKKECGPARHKSRSERKTEDYFKSAVEKDDGSRRHQRRRPLRYPRYPIPRRRHLRKAEP